MLSKDTEEGSAKNIPAGYSKACVTSECAQLYLQLCVLPSFTAYENSLHLEFN